MPGRPRGRPGTASAEEGAVSRTTTHATTAGTRALLACGIGYGVLYVVANDVVAAGRYPGYDPVSQAVSELSTTASPARGLLAALLPVSTALVVGFGIGVRRAAAGRRGLRVTGDLLVAHGVVAMLWLAFPMSPRADIASGVPAPVDDLGHLVLTTATLLFVMAQIGFSAAAFGPRFRVYAAVSATAFLVLTTLTGVVAVRLPLGEPTPWMGLFERAAIGVRLLWMSVLPVVLLTGDRASED